MATLTYCKGLSTPTDEFNELGFTTFEMFLEAYALFLGLQVLKQLTTYFQIQSSRNPIGTRTYSKPMASTSATLMV
jgi:hypothetical protein